MKLLVDIQACQTPDSRKRGIGRYSLALMLAMARKSRGHELHIAANGCFPEGAEDVRRYVLDLVPPERFHVWNVPDQISAFPVKNTWRRLAAEVIRNKFIERISPDAVHVSTMVDGFACDAVTTADPLKPFFNAVTLYDLIPLQYPSIYLANKDIADWYHRKLSEMAKADLWLAISESSRREGIDLLNLPADQVVNISCDANDIFRCLPADGDSKRALLQRFGLNKRFVMYTGGIDHRKNIEGLIDAFGALPGAVREKHQLAIVCSVSPDQRATLLTRARRAGLSRSDIVLTGYVTDEELVALYNFCTLFVFPSWHEGFGLPVLEAMRCGAPVIGANCTSVPEIIGRADAQFDPRSTPSITEHLYHALNDEAFLLELRASSAQRAKLFSWEASASAAWDAFEENQRRRMSGNRVMVSTGPRAKPRLAYVSPLPPEHSGIADYSATLIPALGEYYDIDLISPLPATSDQSLNEICRVVSPDVFEETADSYDRVIYHIGNSSFHGYMLGLIERVPGIIVLHDFFLSGLMEFSEKAHLIPDALAREIAFSHGSNALLKHIEKNSIQDSVIEFPCNLSVIESASGVVCHSEHSKELAQRWYGADFAADWVTIPLVRAASAQIDKVEAKRSLGLPENGLLFCCLGSLSSKKLQDQVVAAWHSSIAHGDASCHMAFVGETDDAQATDALVNDLVAAGEVGQVTVTGFVSPALYQLWLSAADVAIQLRTMSRGETSGAVFDAMAYGLPVVVNAQGSMAELPKGIVTVLPEDVSSDQLCETIDHLIRNRRDFEDQGRRAREHVESHQSPAACARKYHETIERFARRGLQSMVEEVMRDIRPLGRAPDPSMHTRLMQAVRTNFGSDDRSRRVLLDVTSVATGPMSRKTRSQVKNMLSQYPVQTRVDLVYTSAEGALRYAMNFLLKTLGLCWQEGIEDRMVVLRENETVILLK